MGRKKQCEKNTTRIPQGRFPHVQTGPAKLCFFFVSSAVVAVLALDLDYLILNRCARQTVAFLWWRPRKHIDRRWASSLTLLADPAKPALPDIAKRAACLEVSYHLT